MIDELSIKKSYEYIRRIKELNTGLIIELIVFLANIIVGFIVLAIYIDEEFFSFTYFFIVALCVWIVFFLMISPSVLYPLFQTMYLKRNYKSFRLYNVKMMHPISSFFSRRQLYRFEEEIDVNGKKIIVSTNYIFDVREELNGNPFNNQIFECLYDDKKNKLYVMKRIS